MKIYPKTYENVFKNNLSPELLERVGTTLGSMDEYISLYRDFYRTVDVTLFDLVVRSVWVDQQFTFDGNKRNRRRANGYHPDWVYGVFTKCIIGVSPKPLTKTVMMGTIITYLKELFPNFSSDNPFTNPEKYKYPYEHVSLAHLSYVHMVHNRMELLEYAEKMKMNYADFVNWSSNQAFCYNDEVGHAVYTICSNMELWPYLKNNDLDDSWQLLATDFSPDAIKIVGPRMKSTTKYVNIESWKNNPVKNKKLIAPPPRSQS